MFKINLINNIINRIILCMQMIVYKVLFYYREVILMNDNFYQLLMINNTMMYKEIMSELSKVGLTLGQPKVLDYFGEYDGCMQKEIAIYDIIR